MVGIEVIGNMAAGVAGHVENICCDIAEVDMVPFSNRDVDAGDDWKAIIK